MGAVGLGFDSQAGQIGHSVVIGLPPLRRFFGAVLARRYAADLGLANRYALRQKGGWIFPRKSQPNRQYKEYNGFNSFEGPQHWLRVFFFFFFENSRHLLFKAINPTYCSVVTTIGFEWCHHHKWLPCLFTTEKVNACNLPF